LLFIGKRKIESQKIREKYPDRIPVICEKSKTSSVPEIDKTKYNSTHLLINYSRYLVPSDLTVYQFSYIIRKRLKLSKEQSLWLFVNGKYAVKGGNIFLLNLYITFLFY
jgi:GABA(A) receptor-associated protein